MLIYDALKKDHTEVKGLLERLVGSTDADKTGRDQLIDQIRDALIPHSRAEEAVFYNSLRSLNESKDLVMHSFSEHMEAEGLLRALQAEETLGTDWHQTAKKLQQALLHHISEEEGPVFSAAQRVLSDEEARQLGEAFEKMKPEIKEGGFMKSTFELIYNLMPQRFMEPLKKYTTTQQTY